MSEGLPDVTGYAVSCSSQEAVEWCSKGIVAFVTLNGDAMTCFNKALELEPDFLLVHCVLVSVEAGGCRVLKLYEYQRN